MAMTKKKFSPIIGTESMQRNVGAQLTMRCGAFNLDGRFSWLVVRHYLDLPAGILIRGH